MDNDSVLQSTPQELIALYYKTRLLNDLQNRFLPTEEQSLDRDLKKLDLVSKKRMLGIPLSDDDYENAVNEEKPFVQRNLGMMAVGGSAILGRALKPLPSLKAFEKPAVMNYGSATKLNDLGGLFKYFGTATTNKNKEIIGDLLNGWIRRGVFRR
jgi:hypothetical protein